MNNCLQIIKREEWKSVMQYLIICTDLSCFQEQPSYQHQNHKLVFELASDVTWSNIFVQDFVIFM